MNFGYSENQSYFGVTAKNNNDSFRSMDFGSVADLMGAMFKEFRKDAVFLEFYKFTIFLIKIYL